MLVVLSSIVRLSNLLDNVSSKRLHCEQITSAKLIRVSMCTVIIDNIDNLIPVQVEILKWKKLLYVGTIISPMTNDEKDFIQ